MINWLWCAAVVLLILGIKIWIINAVSEGQDYYEGKFGLFTDLDYKVFLDASLYESPYDRHTYRYSPLLSYIFSPSYKYDQRFGKYLIAILDVVAAYFFYKIGANRMGDKSHNQKLGLIMAGFVYLNPFNIFLGTRGSCEGITMTIAGAFLYFYFSTEVDGNKTPAQRIEKGLIERQPNKFRKYMSYVLFGLWVHFRVYPIIFVPLLIMHEYYSVKENRLKHAFKFTVEFGLVAGGVFIGLALLFYYMYGYDFLHETYLYHLTRRDNRHSKSVFFYDLYLNYESDALQKPLYRVIGRNLPNLALVGAFSFYFSRTRSVLYCITFMTAYFVLFNRVITDQYYIWLMDCITLALPQARSVRSKRYGWLSWLLAKGFLLCVPTMAGWGRFNALFQGARPDCTMFSYWVVNILNIFSHIYIISTMYGDELDLQKSQPTELQKPIKND